MPAPLPIQLPPPVFGRHVRESQWHGFVGSARRNDRMLGVEPAWEVVEGVVLLGPRNGEPEWSAPQPMEPDALPVEFILVEAEDVVVAHFKQEETGGRAQFAESSIVVHHPP